MSTDKDWEKWGATDAYFGVISDEKYHAECLSESAKEEFFQSGETHVGQVLETIRNNFDPNYSPQTAMDFGCGVGRLIIPMARCMQHVLGVDVSSSMINEAKKNCAEKNVKNARFVESDDALSRVECKFDLVHSFIVLQHIPWRRGRKILKSLSNCVQPGGFLAVQFLADYDGPLLIRVLVLLRYWLPPFNWARNFLKRRPLLEPAMQLNVYNLKTVIRDIQKLGFDTPYCEENKAMFKSVYLYARRALPNKAPEPT